MANNKVTCSLITALNNKPSFVWHEKLGRFDSDWHQHPKGQLMYAENGCIHVNIEGKKLLLPSWYGAWIPPGVNHAIWSNSPDVFIRTIYFGQELEKDSGFEKACVFPVSNLLKEMLCYTEKWHQATATDAEETTFLLALKAILPGEMTKSANVCLPSTTHHKLSGIVDSLQSHLNEKWSLEILAKNFGLSPRTLTRLFNTHLGMSFSRYSKIARAIKALELIENGVDNVSEIASQVGYESISTFSNNFLEICGNRPIYFINKKKTVNTRSIQAESKN